MFPYRQKRASTAVLDGGDAENVFQAYRENPQVDLEGGTPHGYLAGSLLLKEPVFFVNAQAQPLANIFVDDWQIIDTVRLQQIANELELNPNAL